MRVESQRRYPEEVPQENFARGLFTVDIPELESEGFIKKSGKVRDMWIRDDVRVIVTTDRTSAFDRVLATVPGKGQVLNLISSFWFDETRDIVPNHVIEIPHPNVLIAREVTNTLPVEIVLRRYMAKSSTSTSIFKNYKDDRREIYGIHFPDGLRPNQEFPMGTILTPTTKAEEGHDLELTAKEAGTIVDDQFGEGVWDRVSAKAQEVFERGRRALDKVGIILADTKFEFGLDANGKLLLIDEVLTPDSSRFWQRSTYRERFDHGENPQGFDKEILRRWLDEHGFKNEGGQQVPVVDPEVLNQMAEAYAVPYKMITGEDVPMITDDPQELQSEIRSSILDYFA